MTAAFDTLTRSGLAMLADGAPFDPVASLRDSAARLRAAGKPSAGFTEQLADDAASFPDLPDLYTHWAREQALYAARFTPVQETRA